MGEKKREKEISYYSAEKHPLTSFLALHAEANETDVNAGAATPLKRGRCAET